MKFVKLGKQLIIFPLTAYVVTIERLGLPSYWQIWALNVFDRDCKTPVTFTSIEAPTPASSAGTYGAVEMNHLINETRSRSPTEQKHNDINVNDTRFITWCDNLKPCVISLEIFSRIDADDLCFFWSQDAETLRATVDSRSPSIWSNPRYTRLSCRRRQPIFENMTCSSETRCAAKNDVCEEGYVGIPKTCSNGIWDLRSGSGNRCALPQSRWAARASAEVQYLEILFFSNQCTKPVSAIPGRTGVAFSEHGNLKMARRVFDGDMETSYVAPIETPGVEFRFRSHDVAETIDCAKVYTAPFKGSITLERLDARGWTTVSSTSPSTRYREEHILKVTTLTQHVKPQRQNETDSLICKD